MIFIATGIILLLLTIYYYQSIWANAWSRYLYVFINLILISLLVLFLLDFKTPFGEIKSSRRTVILAYDLSKSTGLTHLEMKKIAEESLPEYSLLLIPFSDRMAGREGALATNLLSSLKEILRFSGYKLNSDEIAGMALISDGNETENIKNLHQDINLPGKYPYNVLYLTGKNNNIKFDKSVIFTEVPRFFPLFKKQKISFGVSIIGANIRALPVELRLDSKDIGTVLVNINQDGYGEGSFDLIIKKSGEMLLEAGVAIDSREKLVENNKDALTIEGVVKGFRVLHLSGHPSVDTAYIRRGLQNIPGVDMISFFILRKAKQMTIGTQDELSLIQFPTDQLFRQELDNFDLIIINDFNLREFLSPIYIFNIAKFVTSGGGLLIMGGKESFHKKDYPSRAFEDILPVQPSLVENWQEKSFSIKKTSIAGLTPLVEIANWKKARLNGLNKLQPKEWANVFYKTNNNEPLIVGGISGKGRVITILTDSFWRLSYNGDMSNQLLLKPLISYLLGTSGKALTIEGGVIRFNKKYLQEAGNQIQARIQFKKFDRTLQKELVLKKNDSYEVNVNDAKLLDIIIEHISREKQRKIIDKYSLVNQYSRRLNELSHLPQGRSFLKHFSENGNGSFILANKNNIREQLKKINLKESLIVQAKEITEKPLYYNRGILLFILYLGMSGFFLKSRYLKIY